MGVELTEGPITPAVARKAKAALQAVHSAGLLHRDVSPHNFIIVDRGVDSGDGCPDVFILDFSASRGRSGARTSARRR